MVPWEKHFMELRDATNSKEELNSLYFRPQ